MEMKMRTNSKKTEERLGLKRGRKQIKSSNGKEIMKYEREKKM
jgi:hypothetical protein